MLMSRTYKQTCVLKVVEGWNRRFELWGQLKAHNRAFEFKKSIYYVQKSIDMKLVVELNLKFPPCLGFSKKDRSKFKKDIIWSRCFLGFLFEVIICVNSGKILSSNTKKKVVERESSFISYV